jgi:hypothetical protein
MSLLWLLITLLRFAADAEAAKAVISTDECGDANQRWNWDPTALHPCNIKRITQTELIRRFGELGLPNLYPYPLVIVPDGKIRNEDFANLTTQEHLPLNFSPDLNVTLTGSDSLSSHRRTIPLTQYLHEIINNNGGQTLPDQLGNETWYLFGETFSGEWATFLRQYNLPSCHSCTELHYQQSLIALSFGIGNLGSGVQWHLHGPGFSETIHGRKHWVLYPPENRPSYNIDYASRHWMEYTYPSLENWTTADFERENQNHEQYLKQWRRRSLDSDSSHRKQAVSYSVDERKRPSKKKPWECTINAGEMLYFPDQWHHATINLSPYTVFVSSFTSEHDD